MNISDPRSTHGKCFEEQIQSHEYHRGQLFFRVIWDAQCVWLPMTIIADYNNRLIQPYINKLGHKGHHQYRELNNRYDAWKTTIIKNQEDLRKEETTLRRRLTDPEKRAAQQRREKEAASARKRRARETGETEWAKKKRLNTQLVGRKYIAPLSTVEVQQDWKREGTQTGR